MTRHNTDMYEMGNSAGGLVMNIHLRINKKSQ